MGSTGALEGDAERGQRCELMFVFLLRDFK